MIDLSSKTFTFLDSIAVGYLPLYKAVHTFIHHQCDKEAIDLQKQGSAFVTKTRYEKSMSTFSNVKEAKSRNATIVEDVQQELAPLMASVQQKEEEFKKAKEEFNKCQAKLAGAQAEKVRSDDAYVKAEAEHRNISNEMVKAMVVIDDVERQSNENMVAMKCTRDELLRLKQWFLQYAPV